MKTVVLGAGSWGTALADLLASQHANVFLWARCEESTRQMLQKRCNERYLPGVRLAVNLSITAELALALQDAQCVVLAIPCQQMSAVLQQGRPFFPVGIPVVCASKGLELQTMRTMRQVVEAELKECAPCYAMLSGPSFASEVARRRPTALTLGCTNAQMSDRLQNFFSTDVFRVYGNTDVLGVELGGAVKNVIAIASGISDGLGFGENARAGLITRGLSEMSRLGAAMGARPQTFMGLSGMGDLVLTCTGDESRNRQVGLRIGQGASLESIMGSLQMVAEGVKTTQALYALGEKLGIDLPITGQVHAALFEGKSPNLAVQELMTRPLREE